MNENSTNIKDNQEPGINAIHTKETGAVHPIVPTVILGRRGDSDLREIGNNGDQQANYRQDLEGAG